MPVKYLRDYIIPCPCLGKGFDPRDPGILSGSACGFIRIQVVFFNSKPYLGFQGEAIHTPGLSYIFPTHHYGILASGQHSKRNFCRQLR